jgi:hypothetical protein
MRFLIRLFVLLAVLFCGWWALASYGVSQAISGWVEDANASGWQVEAQTAQAGFPFNIRTDVAAVEVLDTSTQSLLKAKGVRVSARTYWPGYVDIDLPDTPMVFADAAQLTSLQTKDGKATLRLRPGFALELRTATLNASSWTMLFNQAPLISGGALTAEAHQNGDTRARYDITLQADALTPGNLPRSLLSLPATWPISFEALTANGSVTFDAPLRPDSMEGTPPQFRQIELNEAQVVWGALSLRANGLLDVDPGGVPTGVMSVQAKDWRGLLDLAEQAGALPARQRGQIELVLGLLASRSGRPEDMDIDVAFQNGRMLVSGIALGPAPRLVLR